MTIKLTNDEEVSLYRDGILYVGRPYQEGVVQLTRVQAIKLGRALLKYGEQKLKTSEIAK